MFQDNRLLLADPAHLDQTLRTLSSLGVQRLRITVEWDVIAPDANSKQMPAGFNGADPADYAQAAWAPYDAIVEAAARYGLGVDFNVTGGAPLWAAANSARHPSLAHVWYPSASAFGAFVTAAGLRYSGTYTPPGGSAPLPRVNYWSVWNEPNVGSSSLSPQTINGVEVGPRLYRGLLDAAYAALQATGHGGDTILIGELASTGHANPGSVLGMQPLRFVRALYCVDSRFRELRGAAAAARGCPTNAAKSGRFRAQNPALFQATGWALHPYHLNAPPNVPSQPDWVTLADLPKLESALDRDQRVYGSHKRFPIYLTEYGFDTHPPQSGQLGVARDAGGVSQPGRIHGLARPPRSNLVAVPPQGRPSRSRRRVHHLRFRPGVSGWEAEALVRRVPFADLDADRARSSGAIARGVGMRPAGQALSARRGRPVSIQLNGRTVRTVKITNPEGYFDVHVAFPGSGTVRLAWTYPHGARVYSRSVKVTETG